MIVLPDVNVLVAIAWPSHVHHENARDWFVDASHSGWATSPATESGFLRMSMNAAVVPRPTSALEAITLLERLRSVGRHVFWADGTRADDLRAIASRVQGYRQITDAHLVTLATFHEGAVATLDRGVSQLTASSQSVVIIE